MTSVKSEASCLAWLLASRLKKITSVGNRLCAPGGSSYSGSFQRGAPPWTGSAPALAPAQLPTVMVNGPNGPSLFETFPLMEWPPVTCPVQWVLKQLLDAGLYAVVEKMEAPPLPRTSAPSSSREPPHPRELSQSRQPLTICVEGNVPPNAPSVICQSCPKLSQALIAVAKGVSNSKVAATSTVPMILRECIVIPPSQDLFWGEVLRYLPAHPVASQQ